MRYFTPTINIDQPTTVLFQPALLRHHPHIVEIGDHWGRYGSGIGVGSHAGLSSLGEYYERRHFFSEVSSHNKSFLHDTLSKQEALDFGTALEQTMVSSSSIEILKDHTFKKTQVKRLSNFSNCEIPTVCLSISPHNLESDNEFHPVRDTCGCSFHWNLESAISGALRESIERQFLLKFWLTKKIRCELGLLACRKKLTTSAALPLLNAITSAGEIKIFDITDENFPGKCIIVLYGSDNSQHPVSYCTGMAYSNTAESALEKAIYELWQTFRFIRNFHASDKSPDIIKDPYLRHFLNSNKYSTYLDITTTLPERTLDSQPNHAPLTTDTLIAAIRKQGISGYLYLTPTTTNRKLHFMCKYTSPTAFMHMNNSSNINIKNKYSEKFHHQIVTERQTTMVPFP